MLYGSDLFLTLPWLFLLMIMRSALPLNMPSAASAAVTFLLLATLGWPAFARINFARAAAARKSEWMLYGQASGLRTSQLTRTHVWPHLRPLLFAQFLIYLPVCVTAEANLGALGLGISEPLPSWGSMLLSLKSTAVLSHDALGLPSSSCVGRRAFAARTHGVRGNFMSSLCRYVSLFVIGMHVAVPGICAAEQANEIAWALKYDPKTLDPAQVDDQVSNTIRFLTAGVLLRLNRQTLESESALAESWQVSADGKLITLHLRKGLRFSDGTALEASAVVWSLRRVLAAATAAPVAEEFGNPGSVRVEAPDPLTVRVHLSKRIVGIGQIFDEIAIEPANRPSQGRVTAGPFTIAEYKRGESLYLKRNPYYWKHDAAGRALPYLDGVRLDILANPEQNELRFLRGQYQLLETVSAEDFAALARKAPRGVRDLGASLNTEQMWFNQAPAAPLPAWEKAWFTNRAFRTAVSLALRRDDMVRIAYDGHATSANGFISSANTFWQNRKLAPARYDVGAALHALETQGFRKNGTTLMDREGHPVRFSLLTNAGNRSREKMAVLIQQDLATLGMQVNIVTLDFPALIERLMHKQDYEAALLGLSNVEPDPSSMENIWMSSSPNHQWNPAEKTPATSWEAEIDQQMRSQASSDKPLERKHAVDRVQEIVAEQQPFIYLVYPNSLYAASPRLAGVLLTPLQPGVVSNIEFFQWSGR